MKLFKRKKKVLSIATYLLLLPCSTTFAGIDSIEMNMKDGKLTVIGDVDPVEIVRKLKKNWHTEILTVGPAKEEKKKEEPKKDDKKKEDPWKGYCPPMPEYYIPHPEENPNNCVIC